MRILTILSGLIISSSALLGQCLPPNSYSSIDVNNVDALLLNGGDAWWDFSTARYEVPRGSNKTSLFSGGIWIGGQDLSGGIHLSGVLYRQLGNDYFSGPITENGSSNSICEAYNRHWKINGYDIQNFLAGIDTTEAIRTWPAKGNPNFTVSIDDDLAPFIDANGNGIYNVEEGDYPMIKGDQCIFWVFNDVGNLHTETGGDQVGIEVHAMAYAYASQDDINNTTFYDYTIINKGEYDYNDFYIGHFTDVDLGNSQDDYIGVDVHRNMGYGYNGDSFDDGINGYGYDLPMIGVRFNQTPSNAPMKGFTYLTNSGGEYGSPTIASEYYNLLSGYTLSGTNRLDLQGDSTFFTFSGVPGDTGDVMCASNLTPGEYKMLQSYGPLSFEVGASTSFSFSVVWKQDSAFNGGGCPDIDPFLDASDLVDQFYNQNKCNGFIISASAQITADTNMNSTGAIDITSLGSEGMFHYSWSNGMDTRSISGLSTGAYTLTVTNGFGCTDSATFMIPDEVGIEDRLKDVALRIYPNPTNDKLVLSPAPDHREDVQVFNVFGQCVATQKYRNGITLGHLAPGHYWVKTSDSKVASVMLTNQ